MHSMMMERKLTKEGQLNKERERSLEAISERNKLLTLIIV